jgi:hypothetical protein
LYRQPERWRSLIDKADPGCVVHTGNIEMVLQHALLDGFQDFSPLFLDE